MRWPGAVEAEAAVQHTEARRLWMVWLVKMGTDDLVDARRGSLPGQYRRGCR